MTERPYIKQFLPQNQALTEITRGLFSADPLPSAEQVNDAIASRLRGFLVSIGDSDAASRPEGYAITTENGDVPDRFCEALLQRVVDKIRIPMETIEDKNILDIRNLLKPELRRLATMPDLDLPWARLALSESGEVRIFSTGHHVTIEPIPGRVRATVVRPKLDQPD